MITAKRQFCCTLCSGMSSPVLAQNRDTPVHNVYSDDSRTLSLPRRILSCVCKHAKIRKVECRDKREPVLSLAMPRQSYLRETKIANFFHIVNYIPTYSRRQNDSNHLSYSCHFVLNTHYLTFGTLFAPHSCVRPDTVDTITIIENKGEQPYEFQQVYSKITGGGPAGC